jgi:mannonate dehydratase
MDRIMSSIAGFERLLEMSGSESNGITLCQGNFTLMTDDLPGTIRSFGSTGRIGLVHFRDVRGSATSFVETFHDEGQTDMLACMRAYHKVGYGGLIRSDHVPLLEGDTQKVIGYSEAAQLFALGYMVGLREAALLD